MCHFVLISSKYFLFNDTFLIFQKPQISSFRASCVSFDICSRNYKSMSFWRKEIDFCPFSHKLLFWKDFTSVPCPDMQFCSIVDVVECEQLAREATEPSNFKDACRNHLINHEERKTKCHNSSRKVACKRQFIFTVFIIFRLEGGETPDGLLYLVDWWIN